MWGSPITIGLISEFCWSVIVQNTKARPPLKRQSKHHHLMHKLLHNYSVTNTSNIQSRRVHLHNSLEATLCKPSKLFNLCICVIVIVLLVTNFALLVIGDHWHKLQLRAAKTHTHPPIFESFHLLAGYTWCTNIEDCRVDLNAVRKLAGSLISQGHCTVLIISDKYVTPLS